MYAFFQCENDLDKTFIWKYTLIKEDKCRGMLGCHYNQKIEQGKPLQDIIYEVLIQNIADDIRYTPCNLD